MFPAEQHGRGELYIPHTELTRCAAVCAAEALAGSSSLFSLGSEQTSLGTSDCEHPGSWVPAALATRAPTNRHDTDVRARREEALRIKALFDDTFAPYGGVELPVGSAEYLIPGWLEVAGWRVAFAWGGEEQTLFLDYAAEHRMTDPSHVRLWGDGRKQELDAPSDALGGAYNRAIKYALYAKGLWPWESVERRHERWAITGFDPHELFRNATAKAATLIDTSGPKPSFLEARVERAMLEALTENVAGELTGARQQEYAVPGWTSGLGALDLYIRHPDGTLRVAAELKVGDVEAVLWDLLKLADTFDVPSTEAAFLVVAAKQSTWASQRDGAGLLSGQPGSCLVWNTSEMLREWEGAWRWLLKNGTARPINAPATLEVEVIAVEHVPAFPSYELRVAAVRPVDPPLVWFEEGWPVA